MRFKYSIFSIIVVALFLIDCGDNSNDGLPNSDGFQINFINPNNGKFGTEVTINGENFAATSKENNVHFNGVEASLIGVSNTELVAEVPEGAGTGPVSVKVEGKTAEGPVFTIDPAQVFEGEYLSQAYQIQVQSATDTTLTIEKSSEIEIDLIDGSTDEVIINLEEFLEDGLNYINAALGVPTNVIFDFEKAPIGEISENKFEIDDTDFEIKGDGETLPAEVSGSGILKEGTITFTFEYTTQTSGSTIIISADTDFERE